MRLVIVWRSVEVREIAAPASGNKYLLPDLVGVLQHQDAAPPISCFDGAHKAGWPCSNNDNIVALNAFRAIVWGCYGFRKIGWRCMQAAHFSAIIPLARMLRRGTGGCYLLVDVFFSATQLVISVLGYVDSYDKLYNLQKEFNWDLQAWGQEFYKGLRTRSD